MTAALRFDPIRLPSECEQLRKEVRAFLAEEIAAGTFDPHKPNREDTDVPEFSRKVGARGLRMILEDLMLDLMYYIPSYKKVREFQVTKEMVLAQKISLTLLEKAG